MSTFEHYLQEHDIELLQLSLIAGVRYTTVWNAAKGNPIRPEDAEKIRQAVLDRTGVPYTGFFALIESLSAEDMPTIALRKVLHQRE